MWDISVNAGKRSRFIIVLIASSTAILVAIYMNLYLGIDILHTHIFYLPIILAGTWYYKKSLWLAGFFGLYHLMVNYFILEKPPGPALFRAMVFFTIAYIVSTLAEKRDRALDQLEGSRQRQQAEIEILSCLAESQDIDSAIQFALPKIIEVTGVTGGAVRLAGGNNYVFFAREGLKGHCASHPLPRELGWDPAKKIFTIEGNLIRSCPYFCRGCGQGDGEPGGGDCLCQGCRVGGCEIASLHPICFGREALGLLQLHENKPRGPGREALPFLESITGTLGYFIKHCQDQEALGERESLYRLLADNAMDIIYRVILYPGVKFQYVSPAVETVTGYSPENFYQDPSLGSRIVHPGDPDLLEHLREPGASLDNPHVLRWIRKDGRIIWVEQHYVLQYDRQGNLQALEGIVREVSQRIRDEQALKSSYEKIKALSTRILRAYEEERRRLARDLHDEVGQALTAVKINLQMLARQRKTLKDYPSAEKIQGSIQLVDDTLQNVRRQVFSLRPPTLDKTDLREVVLEMSEEFQQRTGIEILVTGDRYQGRLPGDIETALFRCIQEALTNIARHSQASRVEVEMERLGGRVRIGVRDDGKGFQVSQLEVNNTGSGLVGIQERVELLGGKMCLDSRPGQGTRIEIDIPLGNKEQPAGSPTEMRFYY